MKRAVGIFCLAMLLAATGMAQTPPDPQQGHMSMRTGMPGMDMSIPHALMGNWWRDPTVINELHLTEAQRNQLEQASVNLKLALIGAGANGATALVKAESALNSEQVDQAAYTQQVNALADAAARLVKDVGGSMLDMRKILTPDQWQKLQAMRGHGEMMMRERGPRPMERRNERQDDGRRPAPPQK
jgi:Spy/CpxP family protein refolding chaperone